MKAEQAKHFAQETHSKVDKLQKGRLPAVEVLDIYAEDGFVIGPKEILNAFTEFNTDRLPKRVKVLKDLIIASMNEMNGLVDKERKKVESNNQQIDLEVGNLLAIMRDNIHDVPESRMTRKLRIGKRIIEEADRPLLKEVYRNLGFKHCSIEPTSDYIYFDPEVGDIRQPFLKEFHRITGDKYPSLSNYVQCDNSGIESVDVLMYVVGLNK